MPVYGRYIAFIVLGRAGCKAGRYIGFQTKAESDGWKCEMPVTFRSTGPRQVLVIVYHHDHEMFIDYFIPLFC